jgi:transposase
MKELGGCEWDGAGESARLELHWNWRLRGCKQRKQRQRRRHLLLGIHRQHVRVIRDNHIRTISFKVLRHDERGGTGDGIAKACAKSHSTTMH